MAEDVCESWEDLIKDSPNASPSKSIDNQQPGDRPNVQSNNKQSNEQVKKKSNLNSVVNKNPPAAPKILSRNSGNTCTNANNESQPKNIQITFEDSSQRTLFLAQQQNNKVKILQRPKEQQGKNESSVFKNGNLYNAKTIQEREAEYARARLRILGSSIGESSKRNYGGDQSEQPEEPTNNQVNTRATENSSNNLIRKPQGPSSSNFSQRR